MLPAPANKETKALAAARIGERLDRGLVAVLTDGGTLVTWRCSASTRKSVSFRVYRGGKAIETTQKVMSISTRRRSA
ncbi:hypothetical protein [Streptomyces sp. CB00455]|uniref:rhamnogalacturonan endolyase family protein n=1 Tax=Streptomyces sp. CB00455 TaxID=1703927 RepID=UPI000B2F6482|nr:hypothetical protein [Streptomyces sp. CB00455]